MPLLRRVLKKHLAKVFVETGTLEGTAVKAALTLGFRHVRTVELNVSKAEKFRSRYAKNPRVRIWTGTSTRHLQEMLEGIRAPTLIWLDAHPPGELNVDDPKVPLKRELEIVSAWQTDVPVTVMIDDMRMFTEGAHPKHLVAALLPGWEISYETTKWKDDILVATKPTN